MKVKFFRPGWSAPLLAARGGVPPSLPPGLECPPSCRPGRSAPLLAKCSATDGPNQKSHKCVRECFNDYDWLHHDVEDDKV